MWQEPGQKCSLYATDAEGTAALYLIYHLSRARTRPHGIRTCQVRGRISSTACSSAKLAALSVCVMLFSMFGTKTRIQGQHEPRLACLTVGVVRYLAVFPTNKRTCRAVIYAGSQCGSSPLDECQNKPDFKAHESQVLTSGLFWHPLRLSRTNVLREFPSLFQFYLVLMIAIHPDGYKRTLTQSGISDRKPRHKLDVFNLVLICSSLHLYRTHQQCRQPGESPAISASVTCFLLAALCLCWPRPI